MEGTGYVALRRKLIALILLFSLIPLFALGITMFQQFSQSYTTRISQNLQILVENKQVAIDLFLNERVAQLRNTAYTHTLNQLRQEDYLHSLFDLIHSTSSSFIDLGVIDESGYHVAYAGPYQLKGLNYSEQPWFNEAMVRGVYISDVFMGFRNVPHMIIAVVRREGDSRWIIRATIDPGVFNALVRSVQVGASGDAFLVNRKGELQTPARFAGHVLKRISLPHAQFFLGSRVFQGSISGNERIIATSWINNKEWLMVITEDPNEALSPLLRTQSIVVSIILGGVLIICLGTIYTVKSIIGRMIHAEREKAMTDACVLQSSKMAALGKMAAGVAHEINNPLTMIMENAGWVKDLMSEDDIKKSPLFDEFEEAVDGIEANVERAKKVTHRLLGFARRMEPFQEDVDLNTLANQTIKFFENEAMHRNIKLVKDYDIKIPGITSDTSQIQQVLLNILDNAIDAVNRDGIIEVKTYFDPERREVYLSVRDTGVGMSKEQLDKVFDPFYTTKKVGEGTGLGLAISYSIMEKLGGRIMVESEEGNGSTFIMVFPYATL